MDPPLASLKSTTLCQSASAEDLSHDVSEWRLLPKPTFEAVCSLLFSSTLFFSVSPIGNK